MDVVAALRASHDRLASLVQGLSPEQIRAQSFCDEWSVAQVCSHLGSGAEFGVDWIDAAVAHREPASPETFPAVWDRWNNSTPEQQVAQCLDWNETLVHRYEALSDAELAAAQVNLFGRFDLDGPGLAMWRLREHALHAWDVAVTFDPAAVVPAKLVAIVVDELADIAVGFGHATGEAVRAGIRTTDPERELVLEVGEGVVLRPAGDGDSANPDLTLPAEVLVRLVYGRTREGDGVPEHLARVFAPA
jgi:uncharacterized protein (TIGR03083 family)